MENTTRETRRGLSPLDDDSKERVALADRKVQKKGKKKKTDALCRTRTCSAVNSFRHQSRPFFPRHCC